MSSKQVELAGGDRISLDVSAVEKKITINGDSQVVNVLTGSETDKAPSVSAVKTALSGKVSTVAGKGLSTEDYTSAEKTKLAGLESSHYKGLFVSLAALQAAVASPAAGDYADIDAGSGSDVTRYAWDSSDQKWVDQKGVSTAETAASVKTKYESNSNTNAFTDAEKTKLSGIAAGAEVNQNAIGALTFGDVTLTAASKTDTFKGVAEDGITITVDAQTKTVTLGTNAITSIKVGDVVL